MCKYGDYFVDPDIEQDEGVKNVIGLPSSEIERMRVRIRTIQTIFNINGIWWFNFRKLAGRSF